MNSSSDPVWGSESKNAEDIRTGCRLNDRLGIRVLAQEQLPGLHLEPDGSPYDFIMETDPESATRLTMESFDNMLSQSGSSPDYELNTEYQNVISFEGCSNLNVNFNFYCRENSFS